MSKLQLLTKGIIRENPTFVLLLGMCPTLGTTTSAVNGMGMGLATLFVLTLSNVVISLVKNLIPAQVRIPSFIVVIAAFVTVVQLCMEAYTPDLYQHAGRLHSADRRELYHTRPGRGHSPQRTTCSTRLWTDWASDWGSRFL